MLAAPAAPLAMGQMELKNHGALLYAPPVWEMRQRFQRLILSRFPRSAQVTLMSLLPSGDPTLTQRA